jgi:hypothetical protein
MIADTFRRREPQKHAEPARAPANTEAAVEDVLARTLTRICAPADWARIDKTAVILALAAEIAALETQRGKR